MPPEFTSIYFDPTTDFGFKKLFGEEANKDLLMDFLNSMLPEKHQIAELEFTKTEQLPPDRDDRKAFFDVACKTANGETFIVEMQKSRMTYFMDRSLYYTAFPIQKQGVLGTWNFKLNCVYFIGVLDFEYDENLEYWKERQLLRSFALYDNNQVLMTDNLQFKFLQLRFFNKELHELETKFDKWCYFLRQLETFDHIPQILNEPIFMKAFEVAAIEKMDGAQLALYEMSKRKKYESQLVAEEFERQRIESTEKATKEGLAKGMEKGMEKGTEKGMELKDVLFVIRLFEKGYASEAISDLANIPLEKVNKIIAEHLDSLKK